MLRRYRMLDLSRLLPGPWASHILADMGMDVIKVEEPEPRYGMGRDVLTPDQPTPEGERHAAAFNALARNKKSIALNLLREDLRPRSQEVFYRLVQQADVVLEGYRPGVASWMGIEYETLRKHNPRIVMCSISGYGQTGPYVQLAGHDGQFSAVGGTLASTLDRQGEPQGHGVPLADLTSGLFAANSILAALLEREQTGQGQYLDVSMMGSAMALTVMESARYFREGALPEARTGRAGLGSLRCKDGTFISTGNAETLFWENFCTLLDRPQYIALRHGSGPEHDAMIADVKAIFLTKTRGEWLPLLWEAETCAAPINNVAAAFEDPQVQAIGMAWELQHPTEGAVRQLGFPVRFSRTPVTFERFAPILGEHTRELLAEAGFGAGEIAALESEGIVKSWTGDGWSGASKPVAGKPVSQR